MDFNPDTWGTVADWVAGLGTTAAFIVTVSLSIATPKSDEWLKLGR